MQAKNNIYKDAAYYSSRIKDLPADYLKMVMELKNQIGGHRLIPFTFGELCAKLRLDDAKLSPAVFAEKSSDIYLAVSIYVEKLGLKLVPGMLPSELTKQTPVYLTFKPNLHNDDDISYVQGILKNQRKLTQNDMVFVQRMQVKLANYNIMLRVFEGLSLFQPSKLSANHLAVLDRELEQRIMPIEGSSYLRACLSYYRENPVLPVNFANPARCFKRMDKAEHCIEICRILDEISRASGSSKLVLRSDYPLHAELQDLMAAELKEQRRLQAKLPLDPYDLQISKRIALSEHDARMAAQNIINATTLEGKSRSEDWAGKLLADMLEHLTQDSSLLPFQLEYIKKSFEENFRVLYQSPDFSRLVFCLKNGQCPTLQSNYSIVTIDPDEKHLYPFMLYAAGAEDLENIDNADFDIQDPAMCEIFVKPFDLPKRIPRGNVRAFNNYIAGISSFYLLQRSFVLGLKDQSIQLFREISNHFADHETKASEDLITVAGFFYYIYQDKIAPNSRSLPVVVELAVLQNSVLLTLFAQRILRRSGLYLSRLTEPELEVVLLYILHLIKNAFELKHKNNINLEDKRTRKAFLDLVKDFCLRREKEQGQPLFITFKQGQENVERTFYEGLDVKNLFYGMLHCEFMQAVPQYLAQSCTLNNSFGQELIGMRFSEHYFGLLCSLVEREPLITYLSISAQALTAQYYAALNSTDSYSSLLHDSFPLQSSIQISHLMHTFALNVTTDISILHFILKKSGLVPVPLLTASSIADLTLLWSYIRFLEPPALVEPAHVENLLNRLRIVQAAVHCFYNAQKTPFTSLQPQIFEYVQATFYEERVFVEEYLKAFYQILKENGYVTSYQVLQQHYYRVLGESGYAEFLTLLRRLSVVHIESIETYVSKHDAAEAALAFVDMYRTLDLPISDLQNFTPIPDPNAERLREVMKIRDQVEKARRRQAQEEELRELERLLGRKEAKAELLRRQREAEKERREEEKRRKAEELNLRRREEEKRRFEAEKRRQEEQRRLREEEERRKREQEERQKRERLRHQLNLSLIMSKRRESSELLNVIGRIRDANEGVPAADGSLEAYDAQKQAAAANNAAAAQALSPADLAAPAKAQNSTAAPVPAPYQAADSKSAESAAPTRGQKLAALLEVPALQLVEALKSQQSEVMDLREFEGLCLSAHFMSSSVAIEMLNEFSFEHFDEPFFDVSPEENLIYITTDLIAEILPDD